MAASAPAPVPPPSMSPSRYGNSSSRAPSRRKKSPSACTRSSDPTLFFRCLQVSFTKVNIGLAAPIPNNRGEGFLYRGANLAPLWEVCPSKASCLAAGVAGADVALSAALPVQVLQPHRWPKRHRSPRSVAGPHWIHLGRHLDRPVPLRRHALFQLR